MRAKRAISQALPLFAALDQPISPPAAPPPPMVPAPPPPPAQPGATAAPAPPSAADEVGGLPAWLLGRLPLPATLTCAHGAGRVPVVVTWSTPVYAAARAREVIVLTGGEWDALIAGAESHRASAQWLGEWLTRRATAHHTCLTVGACMGGVDIHTPPPSQRWPVARVLHSWGLALVEVAA